MYTKIPKTMDNLMEYVLVEVNNRNLPISEFKIQKLIFKIKMELGESHELYCQLPFYWYLKGPYSEVVTASFKRKLPEIKNLTPKIIYPEIEDITATILDKNDYFINQIDKDIYKEFAPYEFMYPYKYGIYNIAKASDSADFNVEEYIKKIYRCVAKLPNEEYFYEFNIQFSKLSTNFDLINDSGNFQKNWNSMRIPIMEIWKTFVKGLRVKYKDDYYNYLEKTWNKEYKTCLNNLNKVIDQTTQYIDFNNLPKYEYTKSVKKITESTLGVYLRR